MADNPFPLWSEDWLRLQENYWDAWQNLNKLGGASAAPTGQMPPWSQALDQWWQSASPVAPAPVQQFYSHLVEQGKAFFNLTESWRKAASGAGGAGNSMQEWQKHLDASLQNIKASFASGHTGGEKALGELMAFWELPMDTWERTASVMSGVPGDVFESFKLGLAADREGSMRDQLSRFLSVPGLGYTREHQEQYQTLARLILDYQYAKQEYTAQFVKIASGTVERFHRRTTELMEKSEHVETMQALYDLWVDAAEDAYSEQVFSDEYGQVHARLVNTLMAVKKQGQAMVDETLGMLNMPTQQEVNTLQERLQELRRELRSLRAEVQSSRAAKATAVPPRSSGAATKKRAPSKQAGTTKTATSPPKPGARKTGAAGSGGRQE